MSQRPRYYELGKTIVKEITGYINDGEETPE